MAGRGQGQGIGGRGSWPHLTIRSIPVHVNPCKYPTCTDGVGHETATPNSVIR